jgi:phospholipid/cholesterol/gamma-HCH transport system substrate-binding protein
MSGASRRVRARRRSRITGLVVLAIFVASVWLAFIAQNGLPGTSREHVQVAFANVGGLSTGDDVRVADVRVGQISAIDMKSGRPVVTLALDGHRAVYRDATATIAQRSALGANFVDLTPGTASTGRLPAGEVIATPASASAQDLSDLLKVLDAHTRKALSSTLQQTGAGAAGHGQDLNAALGALPGELHDLSSISRALTTRNGAALSDLLTATRSLSNSFAGQQVQLSELLGQLSTTLSAVDTDHGAALAHTLQVAPSAMISARSGLAALQKPLVRTQAALTDLRPGLAALGQATPNLRGLLREAVTPLGKVPAVAGQAVRPVSRLTALIQDARPLSPAITEALGRASTPLAIVAPYAPEVSLFFTYVTSSLQQGDAAGHWLRFYPVVNTQTVDGLLPIRDPLSPIDPYPAPGQSGNDKTSLRGGTR